MYRSCGVFLGCVSALALFAGCPGGGEGGLDTIPVTGTVTLDGSPLAGARVSFSPKGGGRAAVGLTDESGRFELTTNVAGDGALAGSYGVAISKTAAAPSAAAADDPRARGGDLTPEQIQAMQAAAAGAKAPGAQSLLPAKYGSADTSGFTAEVKAGEANDFTFKMTSR